jgi:PAS domain S-box-containing protein
MLSCSRTAGGKRGRLQGLVDRGSFPLADSRAENRRVVYEVGEESEVLVGRVSEERFFTLALDMLCVASLDGYFLRVNKALEETLGYSSKELLSRRFIEFVHPEDREATLLELSRLASGGESVDFENRYRRAGGDWVWLAWKAVPVVEEGLVYATARDMTGRKEVEETLRLRERAIDASTNSILITDPSLPDNPIVYVNPAFEATTGYSAEEVLGKNCRFLQKDDNEQDALDELRESLRRERACTVVLRNYKKDGTLFYNELNVYPVTDGSGELSNYVGIQVDITQRRLDEEELRLRNRAVAASTNGIVITDPNLPDDPIIYVNPAFARMTGYSEEEVLGKNCRFLQGEDRDQAHLEELRNALRERRPCTVVLRNYKKDGTFFWNELNVSPVYDGAGRLTNFIGVQNDVTARLEAEMQVRALNESLEERVRERTAELAEAVEELESFSYSVSHDLRAPIRHIDGFARMLKESADGGLDEKERRFLDTIIRANRRAGNLVDDLLAFSRMGRSGMEKSPVDMRRLVEETIEEIEPDTAGRSIVWSVGELCEVHGDREMLRVAIRNLLSNAVKYTRDREVAKVEVSVETKGEELVFRVRDNGVGFDMAYVNKLFGVFQRLHGPEEFEGTGIGLASVKRIAGRHGGRVWAEGAPDEGAAFYFTIPAHGRAGGERIKCGEDR